MDLHSPVALPTGSKIEHLVTLAGQDIESTSGESMEKTGSSLLREHQKFMLQHFGHKDVATPLGVSISNFSVFPSFSNYINFKHSLIKNFDNLFSTLQSTQTLELALNMEAHLKQDTLCLFNLTIVGCACGALVDLFKAAHGYPESAESKCQAKEFEELEHQLLDKDEEIRVIEPEQDLKEQEELFPHPFQKNPPALVSTSKFTTNQPPESKDKVPVSKPEGQGKKAPKWIKPVPASSGDCKHEIAKKSHVSWMTYPDRVKLADAAPLYLTTSIKLCWTGVTPEMFAADYIKEGGAKVSIYSCKLFVSGSSSWKCNYSTTNSGQIGTHIHRCYLGLCIQCKKCGVHSFHTCNIIRHLKVMHVNDAHVFYDDMPDLSGMQAQDVSHELIKRMVEADKEVEKESGSD